MRATQTVAAAVAIITLGTGSAAMAGTSDDPAPGSPAFVARDVQNVRDAYGRQTAPDGQLTPEYLLALQQVATPTEVQQLREQAANPDRPAVSPGNLAPGWNVGNPYRRNWDGTRGRIAPVRFPTRSGAELVGDVFAPPATRPGPFPAVVITPGSVQGSERMYWWLAEDLAERGYVVLTFDTQGQGRSSTFGGAGSPTAGVPSQQLADFTEGTEDATTFLLSPSNPFASLLDRTPDPTPNAPGRTTKVALIGHSLGAQAVSQVQATDPRVSTVVALDKLQSTGNRPVVPALGVQSEYGFSVSPYPLAGGSSLAPQPLPPNQAPDPRRERATGFDAWKAAGVDSMVVVPRASTHLEYTDIPLALPASRYGQDVTSHYVQAWLDKYLKHDSAADAALLAAQFSYAEPTASGAWKPVTLDRDAQLSYQFCSAYSWTLATGGRASADDVNGVGC